MTPDDVLTFWFEGDASQYRDKWFEKSAEFDTSCTHFTDALRAAKAGADARANAATGLQPMQPPIK